ncbi:unnamed protein product [Blepharisma stoltei]|uniref:Kinesin motor domain-containing protein n=1 Tax=Blepharisma stoltei TaxID=1481888 RepID=A0AAU9KI20_9CILI|nr:unnamed protein product [Blepharisma stoltei]
MSTIRQESFNRPQSPALMSQGSDTSISVIQQPRASNIKVIGRFRPIVDYEMAYSDSLEVITFINEKTVGIGQGKDLESFTLDRIFDPNSTQQEVYELAGKPTIEDVMTGYNGTIFAYGQTGSGKTYTMMGYDIYSEESRGIIPRAASQIFEAVQMDSGEIEYTLKCSMLEIYKETIRDLLDAETKSLRIKQCPRRGIYVQGLTEVCVTSENDMLEALTLGEEMRTVASTKLNKTSSRSHLIFILQVMQKLPNDSEKKGTLNLVDLAGSEKVNNSGVTGNKLEEAKKINLSLSALGNVIHALVQNSDHIPYRDSKLTRLLQESLGGNYKTTLIVACSPSPKNQEETLNTMGFAIRAKAIKNKVKVNIKNSPDNYLKLIEQLKNELNSAKIEIQFLRGEKETSCTDCKSQKSSRVQSPQGTRKSLTIISKPKISRKSSEEAKLLVNLEDLRAVSEDNFPILDKKNTHYSIFETDSLASSFNFIPERLTDFDGEQKENFQQVRETLERDLEKFKKKYHHFKNEYKILAEKNQELENKLASSRTKQLQSEQRANEYYENYHKTLMMINKDSTENAVLKRENEGLSVQTKRLISSLQDLDKRFKEFVDNVSNPKETTCLEFDDRSEMVSRLDVPVITEHDEVEGDKSETYDLGISKISIPIDPNGLYQASPYAKGLKQVLENNSELNKDITIFQLRNQVIHSAIINANMSRTLYSLDWKMNLANHKYMIKRFMCKKQHEQIKTLESMIEFLQNSYKKVVKLYENKEPEIVLKPPTALEATSPKSKFLKTFTNKPAVPVQAQPQGHRQRSNSRSCTVKHDFTQKRLDFTSLASAYNENESHESYESQSFFIRYKNLETRFQMQEMHNFQLKNSNEQYKLVAEHNQAMLAKLEQDVFSSMREEREKWKSYLTEMKENFEKELERKQGEVVKLNQLLGEWINVYMEMQNKYNTPNKPLSYDLYNQIKENIKNTIKVQSKESYNNLIKVKMPQSPVRQSFTGSEGSPVKFVSKGDIAPI